jgi:hypothetical protein
VLTDVPPETVITLAIHLGEAIGRHADGAVPELVEPRTWKGSASKPVHHRRIWAKLNVGEQEIVKSSARGVADSKHHNILDAVGLGLWAIGRRA